MNFSNSKADPETKSDKQVFSLQSFRLPVISVQSQAISASFDSDFEGRLKLFDKIIKIQRKAKELKEQNAQFRDDVDMFLENFSYIIELAMINITDKITVSIQKVQSNHRASLQRIKANHLEDQRGYKQKIAELQKQIQSLTIENTILKSELNSALKSIQSSEQCKPISKNCPKSSRGKNGFSQSTKFPDEVLSEIKKKEEIPQRPSKKHTLSLSRYQRDFRSQKADSLNHIKKMIKKLKEQLQDYDDKS